MTEVKNSAPIICEQCGKVFQGKYAFICPECHRKRLSKLAKQRGLNKIGNEAHSKQSAELKTQINGR